MTGWLVATLSVTLCLRSVADGRSEKIQFSDPEVPVTASNLNHLDSNDEALKRAQERIYAPKSRGPFDMRGAAPLPRPSQPQPLFTKKGLEELEKKKNWAFQAWQDLSQPSTFESALHLKDNDPAGINSRSIGQMEKFFTHEAPRSSLTPLEMNAALGAGRNTDFAGTNIISESYAGYDTKIDVATGRYLPQKASGILSGGQSQAGFATGVGTFSDPWSQPSAMSTADRQRRDDFRKLLNGRGEDVMARDSGLASGLAPSSGSPNNNNGLFRPVVGVAGFAQPYVNSAPTPQNILQPFQDPNAAFKIRSAIPEDPTVSAFGQAPKPAASTLVDQLSRTRPQPRMPYDSFPKRDF